MKKLIMGEGKSQQRNKTHTAHALGPDFPSLDWGRVSSIRELYLLLLETATQGRAALIQPPLPRNLLLKQSRFQERQILRLLQSPGALSHLVVMATNHGAQMGTELSAKPFSSNI